MLLEEIRIMALATPFGSLHVPHSVPKKRVSAVERALEWCNTIITDSSLWQPRTIRKHIAVERSVNGKLVTIYPILAAKQDFGDDKTGFSRHHLPVMVNGKPVCVVPSLEMTGQEKSGLLHTDLVASLLQLFYVEHPPLKDLPGTLGKALYPKAFPGGRYDVMGHHPERERLRNQFHQEVTTEDDALAFIVNLDEQSLIHCHHFLNHLSYPKCAQFHAERILDQGFSRHNLEGTLWALQTMEALEPKRHNDGLPRFMHHPGDDVASHAIENYQPASDDDAWNVFSSVLDNADNATFWIAITRLLEYPELLEQLLDTCQELYDQSDDHDFRRTLLPWMSTHRNMDETIQVMLEELESHELPMFVHEITTYGNWFENVAFEMMDYGSNRLKCSIVAASVMNTSFDRFPLWEQLLQCSSGTVIASLMPYLAHIGTDRAFRLIEAQTNHEFRFVCRRAYIQIASFKTHPRTSEVLRQGTKSAFRGVRRECERQLQLRLDEGLDR